MHRRPRHLSAFAHRLGNYLPGGIFLLFLVFVGSAGYIGYFLVSEQAMQMTRESLTAIADLKAKQIEQFLEERRGDAQALNGHVTLVQELRAWYKRGAPDDDAKIKILSRLVKILARANYGDVIFLDAGLQQRLVSLPDATPVAAEDMALIRDALAGNKVRIGHVHRRTPAKSSAVVLDIITPITVLDEPDAKPFGVAVLRVNISQRLFPLLQTWPTSSTSGEFVVAMRKADRAVFLNELRHRPHTALSFSVPVSDPELVVAAAVRGARGIMHGLDYRDHEVIAAAREINATPWVLVAKMDRQEAVGSLRKTTTILTVGVIVLACAGGIFIFVWWRGRAHQEQSVRIQVEDALQRTRREIEAIMQDAPFAVVFTRDHRMTRYNPKFGEIYGLLGEQCIGMSERVLYRSDEEYEALGRIADPLLSQGKPFQTELWMRRQDGTDFWAHLHAYALNPDDTSEGTIWAAEDRSEHKQAQEQLRESEERYRIVAETATDAIVTIDKHSVITYINAAGEKIFGYSFDEMIGRELTMLMPEYLRHLHKRAFGNYLTTSQKHMSWRGVEVPGLHKDGREISLEISFGEFHQGDKHVFTGIMRDITERKANQLALQRLNRFYQLLSEINYAVMHADSVTEIFQTTCRFAVEIGDARIAIVGEVIDNARFLKPVTTQASDASLATLFDLAIPLDPDTVEGRSPLGTTVRHGTFHVSNNVAEDVTLQPWHALAAQHGIASVAIFPLVQQGRVIYALILLSGETKFFEPAMIDLLNRIASNISFALNRFSIEADKALAQQQLQQFNRDLEQIVHERTLELARTNDILHTKTERLEARSHEANLMGRTTALLQSCVSSQEFYDVLHLGLPELFPDTTGRILFFDQNVHDTLASHVTWGDDTSVASIDRNDCWALRTGSPYLFQRAQRVPPCRHANPAHDRYLCVPLVAQGQTFSILHISNLLDGDAKDAAAEHYSMLATEIADRIGLAWANLQLHDRLENMSFRDGLTGFYNRRFFDDALQRETLRATRVNQPISLMMIDLDHFKRINDMFGHEAGDMVLREVAGLIHRAIRKEDIACRYGGDEFVVILTNTPHDIARQRAESLREEAARLTHVYAGKDMNAVTLSIGVASAPPEPHVSSRLLTKADEAAYQAKNIGRNRVCSAETDHPDSVQRTATVRKK